MNTEHDIDETVRHLRQLLRRVVADEQQRRHARAIALALVRAMEVEESE